MKTNDKTILAADLPFQPQDLTDLFYPASEWEKRFETVVDEEGKEYRHQPSIGREVAAILGFLSPMFNARRVLDLGTCLGYSAKVLAEIVGPDGEVLSIEIDPVLADQAEKNLAAVDLGSRVHILRGDAEDILNTLEGPFDLILIDMAKPLYSVVYDRLAEFLRPGGYLIADDISFLSMRDPSTFDHPKGIADYVNRLLADDNFETIFLPLGDGVTISRKRIQS